MTDRIWKARSLGAVLVPAMMALCSTALHAEEAGDAPLTPERQLDQMAEEVRRASSDRQALADYHHDLGMRALSRGDLVLAVRELTLAVDYSDGTNVQYQKDLDRAAAIAGTNRDPRDIHVENIVNEKLVEEQRLWVEAQQQVETGMAHLAAERFNQAHQAFTMAMVRLESLSYADQRRDGEMRRVRQLIQDSEERRRIAERSRATADLETANARQRELREYELKLERRQIDAMLARAQKARERRDYDEAILYCEQILKMNAADERANDLLVRCRRERHAHVRQMMSVTWDEQHKLLSEEIRKNMLPQFNVVEYSADWSSIDSLRSAPSRGQQGEGEAWRDEIRQQLAQQLTLEFVENDITDVVQFLQQNTGVNIVLDPEVVASGEVPPITMSVEKIRMENALEFIMLQTGLKYVLRDEVLYISDSEGVQGDVVMKIYDIADLTHPLTDFPGPKMRIPDPGDSSAQLVEEIIPDDSEESVDYFIDIVRSVVASDTWDADESGVSIDEHNGQMVVTHTVDIHKQVETLLHTLRNQRGIQINVKTRMLTVEDGTLESIGFNLLGYNSNVPGAPRPEGSDVVDASGGQTDWESVNGPGSLGVYGNNYDDFYVGTINNRNSPDGWYDPNFFGSNAGRGGWSGQYQVYEDPTGLLGSVVWDAVEQSRRSNHAIEPNITLFNGQQAHLVDISQQAYIADYDVSGEQYDPVVSVISYGTVLDVRAIASADRKYITLTLRPTSARLIGFEEFEIDGGVYFSGINYPIRVPQLSYESVETTVTIPDGGSILLAGLSSGWSGRSHAGVPFLSHIPFLGRLFSTNSRSESQSKLIISVTADIILFDELEAEL